MLNIYLSMIETPEDREKFQQIYDQFEGLIFYVARKMTKDEYLVEDIVQETFYKIIKNISTLRYENDKEFGNLIGIMTQHCADTYLKKHGKISVIESEDFLGVMNENKNFEKIAINTITANEVMKIIEMMDKKYSAPLRLKINGYKSDEIAQLLDITPENVRIRIHRAKKIISNKIGE